MTAGHGTTLPDVGLPEPVRFPPIHRDVLDNGLRVWTVRHDALPIAAATLIVDAGSLDDPPNRPGLAAITADWLDEGTGDLDAIALAGAWARLGATLDTDVGSDGTSFSFATLERVFDDALKLAAATVTAPAFEPADLERIRELRLNRLRQLRASPGPEAERLFLSAVFGDDGYAHAALGTSTSVQALTAREAEAFHAATYRPDEAILIVAGAISADRVRTAAEAHLGGWRPASSLARVRPPFTPAPASGAIWIADRPGAPQSELRVGHLGVPRLSPDFHAIVTLNALLGGQFSSRINQRLRQERGYTYGARTSFEMRRRGGAFVCDTSVQSDATAPAIADILEAYDAVRARRPPTPAELADTRDGLTRGYVRHFETPGQIVRAVAQLAIYDLPLDTYDRFVPAVQAVSAADVTTAAQRYVRPDEAVAIVIGDREKVHASLAALGRDVRDVAAEF